MLVLTNVTQVEIHDTGPLITELLQPQGTFLSMWAGSAPEPVGKRKNVSKYRADLDVWLG